MLPAALKDDWSLRLGPSLMSPKHAYKGYLKWTFYRGAGKHVCVCVRACVCVCVYVCACVLQKTRAGYLSRDTCLVVILSLAAQQHGRPPSALLVGTNGAVHSAQTTLLVECSARAVQQYSLEMARLWSANGSWCSTGR